MLRLICVIFCSLVTLLTCSLTTNLLQLILYFTVKQFSSNLYYRINYYICYTYYSLIVFLADWYCDTEYNCYVSDSDYKQAGKEHMYFICNHPGGLDWIYNFTLASHINLLGNIKVYIKDSLKYVPGLGLNFNLSDSIFLSRNYNKDKEVIESKLRTLMNYPSYVMISLPAEGTRFTKEKHELSVKFAKERGLPILKHHLTPRTKGFLMSLPIMRENFQAVYDGTIAFKSNYDFFDILLGKKIVVYSYFKRIPIEEIPTDEEGASTFLHDVFVQKDKIMDIFYKTGNFEEALKGTDAVRQKSTKNYFILINTVAWCIISVGLIFFGSFYLLMNGYTFLLTFFVGFYLIFFGMACLGYVLMMKGKSTYGLNNNNTNNIKTE